MTLRFDPLNWPDDATAVVEFLVADEWPFHGVPNLSPDDATRVRVVGDDVASFWIRDDGDVVGLIRLFDLDDTGVGSPLFDLRIAEHHRGRGVGRSAVAWLTGYLFATYPTLHRVEATTRDDNLAMQSVFAHGGYRLEGRFVEAWVNADGTRADALSYAILRREHVAAIGIRAALRGALTAAMKQRRSDDVAALRNVLAAIDNAEAVAPADDRAPDASRHIAGARAGAGSTEVARAVLSSDEVVSVVADQIEEYLTEADRYAELGRADDALRLRGRAELLRAQLPSGVGPRG